MPFPTVEPWDHVDLKFVTRPPAAPESDYSQNNEELYTFAVCLEVFKLYTCIFFKF